MAEARAPNEADRSWIPSTQRPDGSWRKSRRVKGGYVPQDEVEKYESRGKQWVNSIPILPPGTAEDQLKLSKNQKKNERRKGKREEHKPCEASGSVNESSFNNETVTGLAQRIGNMTVSATQPSGNTSTVYTSNPDEIKQRKLKNLKKKLRQIEELQSKIYSGELANPEGTQLEKLSRKEEIEKEILDLESELGS